MGKKGDNGFWACVRTNLILYEPTNQLLRRAVVFPLDATNKDQLVGRLHVQRPVHGLLSRVAGTGRLSGESSIGGARTIRFYSVIVADRGAGGAHRRRQGQASSN